MQNFIPINIVVGDRTYRIKVVEDDEMKVKGIAQQLNEQLSNFKAKYAGKDMQDYLAMVLLWYVSEQPSLTIDATIPNMEHLLHDLESRLDKELES
jgi:cell division protein ZapA